MDRVLEPEVMDDPAQALAYARADFAEVNQGFVDRFVDAFPTLERGDVADLGCGPADIPLRLVERRPGLRLIAIDASVAMLRLARTAVRGRHRRASVLPVLGRLPPLPLRSRRFDAVLSNSLLHHLPDAAPFWSEIRRIVRHGGAILVVDLHRPETSSEAAEIVRREAGGEAEILRRDFLASLRAAFTVDEVTRQLRDAGLSLRVFRPTDRHWAAIGTG